MNRRVCLVVDNPLRDLDGLVLVAWHLAGRGIDSFLVPMYQQGHDVPAAAPDLVLANYLRQNNLALLAQYKSDGARIGILDTEGAAGKTADTFAGWVKRMKPRGLVDLYCLWGDLQREAVRAMDILPAELLRVTGCPRYDFVAAPWRDALAAPSGAGDYVLINTAFSLVNPRFSSGAARERETMMSVWADKTYVDNVLRDTTAAFAQMKDVLRRLLRDFPSVPFVLRPHPFESTSGYVDLSSEKNLQVRQEGTSLQWIRHGRLLVHLNCSTAVEAVALGKEVVSLEWLGTPALHVPDPSAVSLRADSYDRLCALVDDLLKGRAPAPDADRDAARRRVIAETYGGMDGKSASRVADAIEVTLSRPPSRDAFPVPAASAARAAVVRSLRRMLGPKAEETLRRLAGRKVSASKNFSAAQVQATLDRISSAAGAGKPPSARVPVAGDLAAPHLFSGSSVLVSVC